jgi:hypothetical protein
MGDSASAGGGDADASRDSLQRAVELNDGIVQLLAIARYALDAGDVGRTREAIDGSLEHARDLMSALLATSGTQMRPGDLRRRVPAPEAAAEPKEPGPA